jgi:hypothetical protein
MADPVIVEELPSAAEFIELRSVMGSPEVDEETASKTINNAVFTVCLRDEGRPLGLRGLLAMAFSISTFLM